MEFLTDPAAGRAPGRPADGVGEDVAGGDDRAGRDGGGDAAGVGVGHPLLVGVAALHRALDEARTGNPVFLTTAEKHRVLTGLTSAGDRTAGLLLEVLAVADDLAAETGHRSPATWLAQHTRTDRGPAARLARLATTLDRRWPAVRDALADGRVGPAQAETIAAALDALPDRLPPATTAKAEAHLIDQARTFAPRELRRLGRRILQVVAPDTHDDAEARALEAEERAARARTFLRFRRRGDGTTDLTARLPDTIADRLRTYLHAYTSPRRPRPNPDPAASRSGAGAGARADETAAGDAARAADTGAGDTGAGHTAPRPGSTDADAPADRTAADPEATVRADPPADPAVPADDEPPADQPADPVRDPLADTLGDPLAEPPADPPEGPLPEQPPNQPADPMRDPSTEPHADQPADPPEEPSGDPCIQSPDDPRNEAAAAPGDSPIREAGAEPEADPSTPGSLPLGDRLPHTQALGQAFCDLLEALPTAVLPLHGGTATTLIVTLTLDQLTGGTGVADTSTGTPLTAGQARRLACTAGLLAAVLGGPSEILDLGRSRRLFSPAQRKALALRDTECRTTGCTIPAAWCEAHHTTPWAAGGRTDLADALLLCTHHHHRAHDPTYHTTRHPTGDITFHRRP